MGVGSRWKTPTRSRENNAFCVIMSGKYVNLVLEEFLPALNWRT